MARQNKILTGSIIIQWLVLGLSLIVLGGAIAFNIYLEYDRMAARERDRLATQTRVIAENLEHQLASANLMLEGVRDRLHDWTGLSGQQEGMRHLQALCDAMPGIYYIGVVNAEGMLVVSNQLQLVGKNFSYRDYFQVAKQHPNRDTLYVSPPYKSPLDPYAINVTRMIAGAQGEFSGVVTATLDPEYFRTLMASVLYAPDMWDAVAHEDGLLFLMEPEQKGMQGMNLALPGTLFTRHRESGQVSTVFTDTVHATKEMRMLAQRTVFPEALKMDKSLSVAASRDLNTVFRPWVHSALMQAGLYGLVVLFSISGLYVYQRRQHKFDRQADEAAAALRLSAERLQLATEASGIGVWDYDIATGEVVWDDSMYAIYGVDRSAISSLYEAWHSSLLPEDQIAEEAALKATIERGAPYTPRFHIRRGDGAVRYIQARARIYFDAAGKPVRLVGTNEDITEYQQREAALQESEARFRLTFDSAAIGMALVNLEGRFMQVNDALCRIVGYTETELRQKTFQDITHPDDLETDLALMKELLAGARQSYQMEKRYFHKDGRVIWILLSGSAVRDPAGKALYFIAQIQEITEHKALLDQLELQANQDYLTSLSNRRHFMEEGERVLARMKRYGHPFSLFMLDIDHFKSINDTHGHKVGDIVLKKLSDILREAMRSVDIIGRIGGEEFAILLPETDMEKAAEVAERLRENIAGSHVTLEVGLPLHFSASIGVASLRDKDANLDILLNLADQALYRAKLTGRNKVCLAN